MHAKDTILHIQQGIITTKNDEKIQSNWLKIFLGKVEIQKSHKVCEIYA